MLTNKVVIGEISTKFFLSDYWSSQTDHSHKSNFLMICLDGTCSGELKTNTS